MNAATPPSTFDMQGLLNKLEVGKPFLIGELSDVCVTTMLTSHTTLVNGIPVKSGPNCEKDTTKYLIKLGCLEYILTGIDSTNIDISISIIDDPRNQGKFSLRLVDLKLAYLYLKTLEANIYLFPYYSNVIRSYINIFFGSLLRSNALTNDHQGDPSSNILVTKTFYLSYYYGLGVSLSSMSGNFVLGHMLQDMYPGGVAILHYIYKYVNENGVVDNVKFHMKGYEPNFINDFAISQIEHPEWTAKNMSTISRDDFFNKFTNMEERSVLPYMLENLYGYLDDRGVVDGIVGLFRQAITFNKQQKA